MSVSAVLDKLKKYRFISEFLTVESLAQFKRYIITGVLSFSLEYTIFLVLYKGMELWYITANTIVYIIVFWFNFLLNRFWSFKARTNLKRQLILYGTLFIFNLLAITALMYFLSDIAGITPLISKVLVMGAVVSWNFVLYKKIIFNA